MNTSVGTLYIVGTPIGNLEDMSQRAIRILKGVSIIAAEDTRRTRKLLSHFDIHTPMESYHRFSEKEKTPRLIEYLVSGQDVALVSDAGMPGISDPGEFLVKEAIKNNIRVVPIPGPCALILGLSVSGFSTERFVFEGFLPKKKQDRVKRLYTIKDESRTMIFYETGNRLEDTLKDMQKVFGNRRCVVARELTKKFEEIKRGDFDNIIGQISSKKGEFVLIVEGALSERPKVSLKEEIKKLEDELGITTKEAIKLVSARYDIPKREVYSEWHRD